MPKTITAAITNGKPSSRRSPAPFEAAAARAEGAARLAAICDADAVNRQCFADQAARIEALGGIDVCRNAHLFNHTPTPAEQAAMREDGR